MVAERAKAKETEKDETAASAGPSTYTLAEMQEASTALFGVPGHIIVGAAANAGYNAEDRYKVGDMKSAIDEWLQKEVK